MRLLFSYLRKSWKAVLLILLLLSVKVASDLALPYYTSVIVNVGIQQGGIENPVPEFLSAEEYTLLSGTYGTPVTASYTPEPEIYRLSEQPAAELSGLMEEHYAGDMPAGSRGRQLSAIERIKEVYRDAGVDLAALQRRYILSQGLWMILITFVSAATAIAVAYIASGVAAETGRDLRERVFHTVLSFHQKEIDRFGTPTLITRSTNDVTQIQNSLVMILRVVFLAPLMGIGGVIQVLATGTPLTWTIALGVGILIGTVIVMFQLVMPRFRRRQLLVDSINGILRQSLKGLLVIRSFNRQNSETEKFEQTNDETMRVSRFVNRSMSAMHPIMMLIMNLTAILIVFAGSSFVLSSQMQVGDIMAFIQYSMMIIMSFLMISMLSIMLPRAAISAQRVEEILRTESSIRGGDAVFTDEEPQGRTIVFDHVSFTFPGAQIPAVQDISCTFLSGSSTGIIGSTGCGKSTILNLIGRYVEPEKGSITIDGTDISSLTLSSLRDAIGYVPQNTYLFSGSASENISFPSRTAEADALREAAKAADADAFVQEREQGYQSSITSGGTNLSGGQRQRLAIARALYTRSPILLFDDSFSAVDSATERRIRQSLAEKHPGTTMIFVSQKVSTIRDCDSIIVLDEGRLVSRGTHEELLSSCPVYQEIAASQEAAQEVTV